MHVSVVGYLVGWMCGNLRYGCQLFVVLVLIILKLVKAYSYSVCHVCTLWCKLCDSATNKRRHFMSSLMVYGKLGEK